MCKSCQALHTMKFSANHQLDTSCAAVTIYGYFSGMKIEEDSRHHRSRSHWVPDTDNFGCRLVLVRHEMGWNMKEAAISCGINPQSWREWELSGRRPHNYEGVCKQIAVRTGCNLMWLMIGDPNPTGATLPLSLTSVGKHREAGTSEAGSLPCQDSNPEPIGRWSKADDNAAAEEFAKWRLGEAPWANTGWGARDAC